MKKELKYTINQDVFTGLHTATLLDGEFDNCHGRGRTPNEALVSLKLTIKARRRNAARADGYDCINDTYVGRVTEKMVMV